MVMASTENKLIEMRMSVMARAYRDQENMVGAAEMDFDERLAMLVDAEWDGRRTNKRMRLLRQAQLCCPEANVTDVLYDADRGIDRDQITRLAQGSWIDEGRNVLITGATGAGKSWIACALGVAACNAFHVVRYVRTPELLDDLCVKKDEDWAKTKKRYVACDLLIVDDWMLEPLSSAQAREVLEIVEARHRRGSMLLCSQFAPSGWAAKIGEGAVAEAIIDRLVYNSYTVHLQGKESMRKRMSDIA